MSSTTTKEGVPASSARIESLLESATQEGKSYACTGSDSSKHADSHDNTKIGDRGSADSMSRAAIYRPELKFAGEFAGDQLTWLNWMRSKYALFSIDLVIACLIDYARFADRTLQRFIFSVIRCRRCGRRFDKSPRVFSLAPELDASVVEFKRLANADEKSEHRAFVRGKPDLSVEDFDIVRMDVRLRDVMKRALDERTILLDPRFTPNYEWRHTPEDLQKWVSARLGTAASIETYAVELATARLNFLNEMITTYNIPSIGKAIRILIDYAQQGHPNRTMKDSDIQAMLLALERRIFWQTDPEPQSDEGKVSSTSGPATVPSYSEPNTPSGLSSPGQDSTSSQPSPAWRSGYPPACHTALYQLFRDMDQQRREVEQE